MKTTPLVLAAVMGISASVRSQEQVADAPANDFTAASVAVSPDMPAVTRPVLPTPARILGNIPDGTPPPPQPPKPLFVVPPGDILATTTQQQGGRTITFQKIKPIALPPPPEPAPLVRAHDDTAFVERIAASKTKSARSYPLALGATVYRFKDSPSRTLVQYRPDPDGEPISFWSSADFSLIAGGIHSFVDSAGQTHTLLLPWGIEDLSRPAATSVREREYRAPVIPAFPEGPATFRFIGARPDAATLVAIQSLHDVYNSEYTRLKTAYEGRERARIEREAWLKANPPQPKNITLNYWRTEKPAAAQGGGQ